MRAFPRGGPYPLERKTQKLSQVLKLYWISVACLLRPALAVNIIRTRFPNLRSLPWVLLVASLVLIQWLLTSCGVC